MASLDILSPLAGDEIPATIVQVVVAYDFQAFRTGVTIYCALTGSSSYQDQTDVNPAIPATHTFTFASVAAGDYRVTVRALKLDDYEDPVHIGQAAKDPQIGVDPPPAGQPPPVLPVDGTHDNLTANDRIEVSAYGYKASRTFFELLAWPVCWLVHRARRLGSSAVKSKKPFGTKFRRVSSFVTVPGPYTGNTWSARVPVEQHPSHLMVQATLRGNRHQKASRGWPRR